jgi:predicted nucleic acid-binding protein
MDLLESLAASIAVPQSVIREIEAGTESDASTGATVSWAKARGIADMMLAVSVASWDLGAGESEVITHCLADPSIAVLDDGEARACAQAHTLPVIGTLGIILRARKQKLVPAARPLIEQLISAGSHLNRELVEQALKQVGE